MQGYFLSIGELLADLTSVDYCDSLETANTFGLAQGGSPANVAANIKFLGGDAKLVGAVGNDGIGRSLLAALKKTGISIDDIQVVNAEPTSIVLVSRSKGTPDFTAYRHADTCIGAINDALLNGAMIVHSTAFALSKQPSQDSIIMAMEKAHDLGKTISLDWNFAPQIWGADNGKDVFEKVIDLEPLLKISVDDMERYAGKSLSIGECKKFLEGYSTKLICLTCGKDGVWFKEKDCPWKFRAAKPVTHVADVTGAGDAFWAGFIFEFMKLKTIETCIENGLKVAARKVQKNGPLYT